MTEKPVYTNEAETMYRVAVIVFANVPAVDYTDACHIAERAVRGSIPKDLRWQAETNQAIWDVPIDVADIKELNVGSGDLLILPSIQPYRHRGVAPGRLPEGLSG